MTEDLKGMLTTLERLERSLQIAFWLACFTAAGNLILLLTILAMVFSL